MKKLMENWRQFVEEALEVFEEEGLEEVAPPGMEDVVKKLKKDPDVDNPWAVAWAIYNKNKENKSE